MELTAKLIQKLPLQKGNGRNGEWKKQDIIVETDGQYPKKVCVSLWGNKFDNVELKEGNNYVISFDVESREFNGRWYTDVKAWRIQPQQATAPQHNDDVPPPENPFDNMPFDEKDDIPF
ncbi:MAG: DUF3127 domain-containing protein [Fermentimonas sp.]|jgi:hypothetical protein